MPTTEHPNSKIPVIPIGLQDFQRKLEAREAFDVYTSDSTFAEVDMQKPTANRHASVCAIAWVIDSENERILSGHFLTTGDKWTPNLAHAYGGAMKARLTLSFQHELRDQDHEAYVAFLERVTCLVDQTSHGALEAHLFGQNTPVLKRLSRIDEVTTHTIPKAYDIREHLIDSGVPGENIFDHRQFRPEVTSTLYDPTDKKLYWLQVPV
jgi:hypothetical protein